MDPLTMSLIGLGTSFLSDLTGNLFKPSESTVTGKATQDIKTAIDLAKQAQQAYSGTVEPSPYAGWNAMVRATQSLESPDTINAIRQGRDARALAEQQAMSLRQPTITQTAKSIADQMRGMTNEQKLAALKEAGAGASQQFGQQQNQLAMTAADIIGKGIQQEQQAMSLADKIRGTTFATKVEPHLLRGITQANYAPAMQGMMETQSRASQARGALPAFLGGLAGQFGTGAFKAFFDSAEGSIGGCSGGSCSSGCSGGSCPLTNQTSTPTEQTPTTEASALQQTTTPEQSNVLQQALSTAVTLANPLMTSSWVPSLTKAPTNIQAPPWMKPLGNYQFLLNSIGNKYW